MIPQRIIKNLLLGMAIGLVSLFLFGAISVGVLTEKKSFRTSIHGRITNTHTSPIGQATVSLYIRGSDGSERRFECTTNEDGYYSLQTPTLWYALDSSAAVRIMSISADGYVPVSVAQGVPKGNNNWDFQLTESVTAGGRLLNTRGEPMANCRLYFLPVGQANLGSNLRHQLTGITTDNGGRFKIDTVGPFEYRIQRFEGGMATYSQTPISGAVVDLTEPAHRQGLEICINDPLDYRISGQVKDRDGNPVEGAFVWTRPGSGGTWGALSDRQGAFSIIGLDGLGKDIVDINVKSTSASQRFQTQIPGIPLHTDNLTIVVEDQIKGKGREHL